MTGKRITKIVLTGGPCAGKTTGMSWIQNTFEKMGYAVIFMQEPATELKSAGITPARCSSMMSYQLFQMKLQLEKEEVYTRAAKDIAEASEKRAGNNGDHENHENLQGTQQTGKKVLIVCDRGFFLRRNSVRRCRFWGSRRKKSCAAMTRSFIWRRRPRMPRFFTGQRPMPSGTRRRSRLLHWTTV